MNSKLKAVKCELARRSFWEFEKTLFPDFFTDDRTHLKLLADTLQDLYEGRLGVSRLMINMPPRHAKSFTLVNFCQWILGTSSENRIIAVSYNEILSSRFSRGVRDSIDTINFDPDKITFSDIFPNVKIKKGDASSSMWSLENQYFNYLGTGFGGTITGVGCRVGIIDDPVKNDKEAFNDRVLEEHYKFYTDTYLSRLEPNSIQIINMTRWATKDLCGRILEVEPDKWHVLKLKAYDSEKDEMLCESLLSKEDYFDKKSKTSPAVFGANYDQEPVDEYGKMYAKFQTYDELPEGPVKNYTDTADEGKDYLCSINYIEHNKQAYIVDVYYTKDGMEITEPEVAEFLTKSNVAKSRIESNNGGKGFARSVKRILKVIGNSFTTVTWFHQSDNKVARIFSHSFWIGENVFYPKDWHNQWPEFHKSMTTYKKEGKNLHDDAQDTITGIAEDVTNKTSRRAYA